MPLRPGVQIQTLTTPPPRSAPTDTGVWFVAGTSDQGTAIAPIQINSMTDFVRLLGARQTYSVLYDALELFFREGGSAAYVARVVGPGAIIATRNLVDSGAGVSLVVKALGPGAYGNSIKVAVVAATGGGLFQISVYDTNNVLLENSGDLTTQADAIAWSASSQYVRVTLGATSLIPVVGGANVINPLTTGTDDRTNITDAQWLTALNLFVKDLGPGNVSAPGRTTDVGHTQLADHAKNNNRVALLDLPDTATVATLTTSATNAKSTGSGQYAAAFAPWLQMPGIQPNTVRTVPPSALVAGRMAAVDASQGPGVPAAGNNGISRYCTGLSQAGWDDTTRDSLNTAGVNVVRMLFGDPTIYGYRSLADPVTNPYWVPLGTVRYLMGLQGRAWAVGQQFVFDQIDGQGHTISAYQGALVALCQADWAAGEIYGNTPAEAFNVDTGPGINTPTVLAGQELRAAISVRPSPMAELVTIYIINVPITQGVS
jgi:phage tail sheath protein FI